MFDRSVSHRTSSNGSFLSFSSPRTRTRWSVTTRCVRSVSGRRAGSSCHGSVRARVPGAAQMTGKSSTSFSGSSGLPSVATLPVLPEVGQGFEDAQRRHEQRARSELRPAAQSAFGLAADGEAGAFGPAGQLRLDVRPLGVPEPAHVRHGGGGARGEAHRGPCDQGLFRIRSPGRHRYRSSLYGGGIGGAATG